MMILAKDCDCTVFSPYHLRRLITTEWVIVTDVKTVVTILTDLLVVVKHQHSTQVQHGFLMIAHEHYLDLINSMRNLHIGAKAP